MMNNMFKQGGIYKRSGCLQRTCGLMLGFILLGPSFLGSTVFAQVTEAWVASYGSGDPDIGYNGANALAVDAAGNVYVTGGSGDHGTHWDYATIKYNSRGNPLWVARYNNGSVANSTDEAMALAVDGAGNVYVTGHSSGVSGAADYATIKYSSSGVQLWVARYNGLGNGPDFARAIAVDMSGNVYVTGGSTGVGGDYDYVTIKYNASGTQLWMATYSGPGGSYDFATALAIDASGHVIVTGIGVTIKYNPANGTPVWTVANNLINPFELDIPHTPALAVEPSGAVYVTGVGHTPGTVYDYATIKYATNGTQLWEVVENKPGLFDMPSAIGIDPSGNVYVTGRIETFVGSDYSSDIATIKYSPNGTKLWEEIYNGPANGYDSATALAVDKNGNVYIAGSSDGGGTSHDYVTLRYDTGGTQLWERRYDRNLDCDGVAALAVDGQGNAYVTGQTDACEVPSYYVTIKYSPIKAKMIGTGKAVLKDASLNNTPARYKFNLSCNDTQPKKAKLSVRWGRNNFKLTQIMSATCSDDPAISEAPPVAGFDTHRGWGKGTYNGAAGATAVWTFSDAGEPGANRDTVFIVIRDAMRNIVLKGFARMESGNHDALPVP